VIHTVLVESGACAGRAGPWPWVPPLAGCGSRAAGCLRWLRRKNRRLPEGFMSPAGRRPGLSDHPTGLLRLLCFAPKKTFYGHYDWCFEPF